MEIESRMTSRCGRCGKWISGGERIEWERGKPATHLTEAQCAAAFGDVELVRAPILESADWEAFERVGRNLAAHPFHWATTYAHWAPHTYTLLQDWQEKAAFYECVTQTRRLGYRYRFEGRVSKKTGKRSVIRNHYLDINEYIFWTMEPFDAPPQATSLINRAVRGRYRPSQLAWFPDPNLVLPSRPAWKFLWATVGDSLKEKAVLDIGATWGEASLYAARYLALATKSDVARLRVDFPEAPALDAAVYQFVPIDPPRFDVIVALYGAGSHLGPSEMARLPHLARPGGIVIVTFDRTDGRLSSLGARLETWDSYVVAVWRL